MKAQSLEKIVAHCQTLLKVAEFEDWAEAMNGLQVQNSGKVTRIAAAVDISPRTVKMACDADANLLMIHHGFFWGGIRPWTGKRYEILRMLVQNDIAVYSAHLPLDAHPTLGNNALLCKKLGLKKIKPFMMMKGQTIGFKGELRIDRQRLKTLFEKILGAECRLLACGPEKCLRIGVVSGGAGEETADAFNEGVDTYITGEGPHWTWTTAQELGINVLYGGHYKTEQFGIQALAENVSKKFKIPWSFLDDPSGL
ncbi:MAG: Nif3-like dinuclear metal center hexameric protein [Verrucomicrobia bacterium]|nr:Nif3-like dinuclear metal center hexameric protein [Verrucomicrobiota bacterium]